MESIIRKVSDIEADQRLWLESNLGQQLQDNQQVIIRIVNVGVEPPPSSRDQALTDLLQLSQRGSAHRQSKGVPDAEADGALNEAMRDVRPRELPKS